MFCFSSKSDSIFLSKTAAPTSILLFSIKFIWEKALPSLIMTPLKPESLKRVFDPAPSIYIFFSSLRYFFKNSLRSNSEFALKKIFAGPPRLNQLYLESF